MAFENMLVLYSAACTIQLVFGVSNME